MEYRIDSALHLVGLAITVNKSMRDGWQASGAPFLDVESRSWCQALTRALNTGKPEVLKLKEVTRK